MNEQHRHLKLLSLLDEHKALATQQLVEFLDISPATARRDISKLHAQGRLKKVRNGVEALNVRENGAHTPAVFAETINHYGEKKRIAQAAAQLCADGSSVVLACGSTMLMLGEALCGRELQVITNYLPLANALIAGDHPDVVILGGQYNKNKGITLSLENQDFNYAADIFFTSGKGFSEEGLYKNDMLLAYSEQKIIGKAQKLVVLLDHHKLGKKAGMLFSPLSDIDLLITGKEADGELIARLRDKGLEILLV